MGMYGRVRQITPEQLNRFHNDPESLEQFLFGKAEATAANVRAALASVQEIANEAKARGQSHDPSEIEKTRAAILKELMSAGGPLPAGSNRSASAEEGLSLEKSWHALHYLLTGSAQEASPPLGNAIMGGEEIGDERDYGRVRFLNPKEVREVAEAIRRISKPDLAKRFDVQSMKTANVIYACRNPEDLDIALDYFGQLVDYYSDAARRENAMLLYIE